MVLINHIGAMLEGVSLHRTYRCGKERVNTRSGVDHFPPKDWEPEPSTMALSSRPSECRYGPDVPDIA